MSHTLENRLDRSRTPYTVLRLLSQGGRQGAWAPPCRGGRRQGGRARPPPSKNPRRQQVAPPPSRHALVPLADTRPPTPAEKIRPRLVARLRMSVNGPRRVVGLGGFLDGLEKVDGAFWVRCGVSRVVDTRPVQFGGELL